MIRPPRLALIGAALAFGLATTAVAIADDFAFHHENVMGTALELRVRADSDAAARRAEGRVLAEIDRLAALFSTYDPASEIRRWLAAEKSPTRLSPELTDLLASADRWRERTAGAFDPRVGAASRLWSASAKAGRRPTDAELDDVRSVMAAPAWRFCAEGEVERLGDGPITIDGIAKGAIVEAACAEGLREPGVTGILLNVGGDLRAGGDLTGSIAILRPRAGSDSLPPVATVEVRDRAVATSGAQHRGYPIGGRWYSHILDPRTARPAELVASASVIAPDSADADALATALNVMAPEEGLRLVESLTDVACLIQAADGRILRSARWIAFERPAPLAQEPAGDSWGDQYELAVNFEINRPAGGRRYRRPYVVVWVTDAKDYPVRTLVLWVSQGGAGPGQWLPDLRRWYRIDRDRRKVEKTDLVHALGQPTRPPGEYTVLWDGKDNAGKPLPPGRYTIHVEAAREHGTYQEITRTVEVGTEPFTVDLEGNVEIRSASLEFRRKPDAR